MIFPQTPSGGELAAGAGHSDEVGYGNLTTWMPLLAHIAGAAELPAFWHSLTQLLRVVACHDTAVVWCDSLLKVFPTSSGSGTSTADAAEAERQLLEAQRALRYAAASFGREPETLSEAELGQRVRRVSGHRDSRWKQLLVLPFWKGDRFCASVTLYRSLARGDFEPTEIANVRAQHPIFVAALLRILERDKRRASGVKSADFSYRAVALLGDQIWRPTPDQLSILAKLTPAERDVTMLTIRGMSNLEVASQLHRKVSTVKDHLSHIFYKLGVRSRSQLTCLLMQ